MSALTPHIRVLRAEAHALRRRGERIYDPVLGSVLLAAALVKLDAADALEAEEREQEAKAMDLYTYAKRKSGDGK